MCWESEWVTPVYCLLCFPQPRDHSLIPSLFPMEFRCGSESYQQPSTHWLFQGETYCCPICLAVIKIRTVVPSSLSGYQLWQKIPPKLGWKNMAWKIHFLVSVTCQKQKKQPGNGEGPKPEVAEFSKKTIRLDLELGISIKEVHIQNSLFIPCKLMILLTGKSFWYISQNVSLYLYSEGYKITGSNILPSKPSEACSI